MTESLSHRLVQASGRIKVAKTFRERLSFLLGVQAADTESLGHPLPAGSPWVYRGIALLCLKATAGRVLSTN